MSAKLDQNTVRYCLYPKLLSNAGAEDYQNYINDCLARLANYLSNYFWYYTSFNLNYINKESSHSKVEHIEGCTNFDENIEDEWFIVYLLFELSKYDSDLVIQVEDSDGYFLLIETADHLPKWVNPKTSLNRCFIYRNELHLIPIDYDQTKIGKKQHQPQYQSKHQSVKHELTSSTFKKSSPTIQQAIEIVRNDKISTVCSTKVQEQIKRRINDYPTKINTQIHKCKVILPSSIAFLLNEDPTLICHSVRAFYCRDDLDVAACRIMKNFQPNQLINRIVRLSKFNYAQLIGQNYKPDFKLNWYLSSTTGRSATIDDDDDDDSDCKIKDVNSTHSTTAATTNGSRTDESTTTIVNDRRYDLGFKISCGFEILVSSYKKSKVANQESSSRQTTTKTNENSSRNWKIFLDNLKKQNYFDNLIEQSTEFNRRLERAQSYFENSVLTQVTSEAACLENHQISKRICELLNKFECDKQNICKQFKEEELTLSDEDSDQWLNEIPDYLLNSGGSFDKNSFDDLPSEITNCLQEFIKTDSDYKGVDNFVENPKKRKSDLKERAFKMMSDNLRSIITMKVSDTESDQTESDLSDYNYSSSSSADEAGLNMNELRYMKQQKNASKGRKYKKHLNERKKRAKVSESSTSSSKHDNEIKQLMNQMDKELSTTTIGQSFERLSIATAANKNKNVPMANCAEFDEDDDDYSDDAGLPGLNDVDIEYNTVKNLLGSFKEQNGLSGPASTILNQLGVRLPKDLD